MGNKIFESYGLNKHLDRVFVSKIVRMSHSIALSYLRMKASSSRLYYIRNEKLEDLAWDYIADLFECDSSGSLVKIDEHIHKLDVSSLEDPNFQIQLRKLIFTKVDDNIFREAGEKDPSLKKIIRNIKLAVRERSCSHGICITNGKLVIEDISESLPVMPPELLQIHLCERIKNSSQIPDIITEIIDVFNSQSSYKKEYPLIGMALVIRKTYVELSISAQETNTEADDIYNELLIDEMHQLIKKSSEYVKSNLGEKYLKKGKVCNKMLDSYVNAAVCILHDQFTGTHGEMSQFDYLSEEIAELEYSEFRNNHRRILEYIVKNIREKFVSIYKKELV